MILGNEKLIIVDGMAHSGTTVLTYILRQHPDVYCYINGHESHVLENTFLQEKNSDSISYLLRTISDKRVLLKRPWSSVYRGEWLEAEMPFAKYLYCLRSFGDIAKSWSKPTSLIDDQLRKDKTYQVSMYNFSYEKAMEFGQKVPFFMVVKHTDFLENPAKLIAETAAWLELAPFNWDVSKVSPEVNIKEFCR